MPPQGPEGLGFGASLVLCHPSASCLHVTPLRELAPAAVCFAPSPTSPAAGTSVQGLLPQEDRPWPSHSSSPPTHLPIAMCHLLQGAHPWEERPFLARCHLLQGAHPWEQGPFLSVCHLLQGAHPSEGSGPVHLSLLGHPGHDHTHTQWGPYSPDLPSGPGAEP